MASAARILWTKQLTKKQKTWNDGFLLVKSNGSACLFDEHSKELASCLKLPSSTDITADDNIRCFEGYIVQGDCACSPNDIRSNHGSSLPHAYAAPRTCAQGTDEVVQQIARPATMAPCLNRQRRSTCAAVRQQRPIQQQQSTTAPIAAGTPASWPAPQWTDKAGAASVDLSIAQRPISRRRTVNEISCLLDSLAPAECSLPNGAQQQAHQDLPAVPHLGRLTRPHRSQQQQHQQQEKPLNMGVAQQQQQLCGIQAYDTHLATKMQAEQRHTHGSRQQLSTAVPQQQRWHNIIGAAEQPQQLSLQQVQQLTQRMQPPLQQQDWQGRTNSSSVRAAVADNAAQPCWQLKNKQQHAHLGYETANKHSEQQDSVTEVPCAQQDQHQHLQHLDCTAGIEQSSGFRPASAVADHSSRSRWQGPQPDATPAVLGENSSITTQQPLQSVQPIPYLQQGYVPQHHPSTDTAAADDAVDAGWQVQRLKRASNFSAPRMADLPPEYLCPAAVAATSGSFQQQQQQQQHLVQGVNQPARPVPARQLPAGLQTSAKQQQPSANQYHFPAAGSSQLQRHVAIPTEFRTAGDYIAALLAAMCEEVNLQLAEHAKTFHSLVQQSAGCMSQQGGPRLPRQQQQQMHAHQRQHGGSNHLQSLCSRHSLQYCPGSTLTVYQRSQSTITAWAKGKSSKRRKKGGKWKPADDDEGDEDDCADERQQVKPTSMYLTLAGKIDRRKLRKHDLWILSNDPMLNTASAIGAKDRYGKPWILIARALWHGPDKEGKMEIEVLPGQVSAHHRWPRQQEVAALLAPDLATEVQVAEFLRSSALSDWQLFKHLLHPVQSRLADENLAAATAEGSNGCAVEPGCAAQHNQATSSSHSKNREEGNVAAAAGHTTAAADVLEPSACGNTCASGSSSGSDSHGLGDLLEADHVQRSKKRRIAAGGGGEGELTIDNFTLNSQAAVQDRVKGLLTQVTKHFNLNPAQAQVAAHVSEWLPDLLQQQRQPAQASSAGSSVAGLSKSLLAGASGSYSSLKAAAEVSSGTSTNRGIDDISNKQPPICLIHGPFGSGKSTLLVALIHLLTGLTRDNQQQPADGPSKKRKSPAGSTPTGPRILVAAHTNVAVDRVLLALMQTGFTNMLRVGSLQRIDKRLLCHSLHSADDRRDALSQLQSMLQEAQGVEAKMIEAEIAQVKAGAEKQRRRKLATAAVVGVTCCAALQATLEGQHFDVVLLDEASQMTEPTSLVPLIRVKPRFLIAAGDPCQLPPVLATPAALSVPPAGGHRSSSSSRLGADSAQQGQQQQLHGLLRTLFVRLTHLGHVPHLLTYQYRCHPALSALSNKHFYDSRLVDGVTAQQRAALIPGLPPLTLCDCQGGRSQFAGEVGGRSSVNKAEAQLVVQLVLAVLKCRKADGAVAEQQQQQRQLQPLADDEDAEDFQDTEVDRYLVQQQQQGCHLADDAATPAAAVAPHQLGVICFFRGQAALLKQMLAAEAVHCPGAADVQVATVDSFQGAEKEVIILATTTTNPRSEFCGDAARLNVALTRAKRHLMVVGAADVLNQAPGGVLRDLVVDCRGAGCYYVGSSILALPGLCGRTD